MSCVLDANDVWYDQVNSRLTSGATLLSSLVRARPEVAMLSVSATYDHQFPEY
jgi:hypothetical protein